MMIQPVAPEHQFFKAASHRDQHAQCDQESHGKHAGADVPERNRRSIVLHDHECARRKKRDNVGYLRIVCEDLPLSLSYTDLKAYDLENDHSDVDGNAHRMI